MDTSGLASPAACMDATAALYPIRHLLVSFLDSESKGSWRVCYTQAATAVYESTISLSFKGDTISSTDSCCNKDDSLSMQLPMALLAKCPRLQRLRCRGMETLSTLQGLPPNITTLDLARCERLFDLAPLHHLTRLSNLSMEGGYKGAEQPQELSAVLERLPSLEHLQLQRCADQWPADSASSLYPGLASLSNLQSLHLIGHHLGVDATAGIAAAISRLFNLTHLSLRGSYFGAQGAAILAPSLTALSVHSKLSRLELQCNWMRARGAEALAPALTSLAPSLTHLDLSENALGPAGIEALVPALASMRRLAQLHLACNYCGEEGAKLLVPLVGEGEHALPHLQVLNLKSNNLEHCDPEVTKQLKGTGGGKLKLML